MLLVDPHMRPSAMEILQLPAIRRHLRVKNMYIDHSNTLLDPINTSPNLESIMKRLPGPKY